MFAVAQKRQVAQALQAEINRMQGFGKVSEYVQNAGFEPFSGAFPGRCFPTGALHELISYESSDAACTTGFITALAGKFAQKGGLCLWISPGRKVFPTGMAHFGLQPSRVIFINVTKVKEALWVVEEALKCEALSVVVAEIKELGFTESRRFQLAVERSGVTGFIHRFAPKSENATACTARWKITALPGFVSDGLPGVGHSSWQVNLAKVRNGKPASWQISWMGGGFVQKSETLSGLPVHQRTAI